MLVVHNTECRSDGTDKGFAGMRGLYLSKNLII